MKRTKGLTRTEWKRKPPAPRAPGESARRPLERSGSPAAASPRRTRERAARAKLVARLVAEGVACEVCPELARVYGVRVPGGCPGRPGGIHERRKRSSAGTVDHAPNLIPCCNNANGWIEDGVGEQGARALAGPWLVLREGDPEWGECGRDVDPVPVTVKLCQRCGAAFVTVPPSGRLPCGHHGGGRS